MTKTECVFCETNEHRLVYTEHAFAVLDNFPISPGHTLVISNRHVGSISDLTEEERDSVFHLVADVRKFMFAARTPRPDGFNIGINDGVAAGQTVTHLHIHIIPRYAGDCADPRGGVRWIMPKKADYWSV